jgi:hypothetical protein
MKNQNSISNPNVIIKPSSSVSTKQKTKVMDNENKQQEINSSSINETTTTDGSSTPSIDQVKWI